MRNYCKATVESSIIVLCVKLSETKCVLGQTNTTAKAVTMAVLILLSVY